MSCGKDRDCHSIRNKINESFRAETVNISEFERNDEAGHRELPQYQVQDDGRAVLLFNNCLDLVRANTLAAEIVLCRLKFSDRRRSFGFKAHSSYASAMVV